MADRTSTNVDRDLPSSISQPLATRTVCPICMIALPLDPQESIYESCCGKILCKGCTVATRRAKIDKALLGRLQQEGRSKSELELIEFQLLLGQNIDCAFCRSERSSRGKEEIKRLQQRVERFNDPWAMNMLGDYYVDGLMVLKQNKSKALALYEQSFDLGSPEAADRLFYYSSNPQNRQYLKEGVRRGHIGLSATLGSLELRDGTDDDVEYAKQLLMRAAEAGDNEAMEQCLKVYGVDKLIISKQELEATLRAKKAALDEVNSDDRAFAKRFHGFRQQVGAD